MHNGGLAVYQDHRLPIPFDPVGLHYVSTPLDPGGLQWQMPTAKILRKLMANPCTYMVSWLLAFANAALQDRRRYKRTPNPGLRKCGGKSKHANKVTTFPSGGLAIADFTGIAPMSQ